MRHEYDVDAHAVAAAIVERLAYARCSKPRQSAAPGGADDHATDGGPAAIRPTRVAPCTDAPGGRQAHSS